MNDRMIDQTSNNQPKATNRSAKEMKIHESGEMYLENIFVLRSKLGNVRSIDIVNYSGYSKPSISRAVKLLSNAGYINVDEAGYITLTESGEILAKKIFARHHILTEFLIHIGVKDAVASEDACRMEHVISDETYERIKLFCEENIKK